MAGDDLAGWMLFGGPVAALVFGAGVTWLGPATPGYSAIRQTISELGPQGGRGRRALAALNLTIAVAAAVFACGLVSIASHVHGTMIVPAYFIVLYAVLTVGLALFPSGHPLHNVFGLLQTVPFVGAPLSVALGWRGQGLTSISWLALVTLVVAMVLNLAPAFSPRLARRFAPVYGVLQGSLFVAWYGWCALLGLLLFLRA
jgi:hypothetical protein